MQGNPPSTTSTRLSLSSPLNPPNFHFCRHENRTRGKARRSHMSALWSPTFSPPPHHPHFTTSHLSSYRVSSKSTPFHFALPCTAERMFPLRCAKSFLCALTLLFPLLFPQTSSIHHTPLRRWRSWWKTYPLRLRNCPAAGRPLLPPPPTHHPPQPQGGPPTPPLSAVLLAALRPPPPRSRSCGRTPRPCGVSVRDSCPPSQFRYTSHRSHCVFQRRHPRPTLTAFTWRWRRTLTPPLTASYQDPLGK